LDFPASIDFGVCPVNHDTTRPFPIRNLGPRATRFSISADPNAPFSITPNHGFLEVNQNIQVSVAFRPMVEGKGSCNLWIEMDGDVKVSSVLSGTGQSADIRLELDELTTPATYINLSSQKTVRLYNHSDIPVTFFWKTAATRDKEEERRKEILVKLAQAEARDRSNLEDFMLDVSDESGSDESEDADEQEHYRKLKAEQAISRKYKKLRQDLQEENLGFMHENFTIEPVFGEIWPTGMKEITVTFKPTEAILYPSTAFCDVTGCVDRLPLQIKGQGVGPKAVFTYDNLDIGEVYINAVHRYEVVLQNVGDIEAQYQLDQVENSRFEFAPDRGNLGVYGNCEEGGEQEKIAITFSSDTIGEFTEVVSWALQGTVEPLTITFKGNVIGPTFYFEEEVLDFGVVSYGFLNSQILHLHNTSEIPMKFTLRIPEDGKFMQREFGIVPSAGSIFPGEKGEIKVDFISEHVKKIRRV
jgi:hydrocephalus-inducing protein